MANKPKNNKRSLNAQAVAKEIIATVGKGGKVNKGKIIKKHGYTDSMSRHPEKILETLSAKEIIDPFVGKMVRERDAAINAMTKKRGKANYRDLVDAADKLTKNIQLLSGRETENKSFNISMLLDEIEGEK